MEKSPKNTYTQCFEVAVLVGTRPEFFPLEGNPLAAPLICRSVRNARVSSPLLRFGSISLDNIDEPSTPIELGASQARGITTEG